MNRSMLRYVRWLVVLVVLVGSGGAASAQATANLESSYHQGEERQPPATGPGLTLFTDRASFDAANPGLPIEDFEEGNVTTGNIASCSAPLNELTNNICFTAGEIQSGLEILTEIDDDGQFSDLFLAGAFFFGSNDNPSKFVGSNFSDPYILRFTSLDVTAVGLDVHLLNSPNPAPVIVDVFGIGGVLLGSTTVTGAEEGTFLGISSTDVIEEIVLDSTSVEGADNIAFGATPAAVPVTDGWGLGLTALAFLSILCISAFRRLPQATD